VTSEESQESVARRAGFGSPETMRRIFRRNLGVSPGGYRSRFRTTGIDPQAPASDLVDHGRTRRPDLADYSLD
jgi:AraC-like DNA-binding protein